MCVCVVYQFHANDFDFGEPGRTAPSTQIIYSTTISCAHNFSPPLTKMDKNKSNKCLAVCVVAFFFPIRQLFILSYCYLCTPYLLINVSFVGFNECRDCVSAARLFDGKHNAYQRSTTHDHTQAMSIRMMMISSVVSGAELAATTLIAFCKYAQAHSRRPASFAIHLPRPNDSLDRCCVCSSSCFSFFIFVYFADIFEGHFLCVYFLVVFGCIRQSC